MHRIRSATDSRRSRINRVRLTENDVLFEIGSGSMKPEDLRLLPGAGKKLYVETYGCQMNVGDSEILVSIMQDEGYAYTEDIAQADVILVNTCSIRDNAEQRIWGRLKEFHRYKRAKRGLIIGIVGCMAERLREDLLEREAIVDVVSGPDSYRDLPRLVAAAASGSHAVNVQLSEEETYGDIRPVRLDRNGVGAFIAIMRGCNNFCSYCVVPYTRGRERSRDPRTIVNEARELFAAGYREVTLLGQNVNSYRWEAAVGFPELIEMVAAISPLLRVRFATSHPKDISDRLLEVMASHSNVCRAIHLPAQSGSSRILAAMNRKYTREWYLERVDAIRKHMPDCVITTDLIAGFCGETLEDHRLTLSLMREVEYDAAYMFKYSRRPGTQADRLMTDDVPEDVKTGRLNEIIACQNELSLVSNRRDVGKIFEVLVEGPSRRSPEQLCGRTSGNKMVVFEGAEGLEAGTYVNVKVTDCTSATLLGTVEM